MVTVRMCVRHGVRIAQARDQMACACEAVAALVVRRTTPEEVAICLVALDNVVQTLVRRRARVL